MSWAVYVAILQGVLTVSSKEIFLYMSNIRCNIFLFCIVKVSLLVSPPYRGEGV